MHLYVCRLCKWNVPLDDLVIQFHESAYGICLRCWTRETRTEKPLAAALSREATRTVEEAP